MFDNYRMLRSSGMGPIGSALMSLYLFVVAGPILLLSDWYDRSYAGETGFEFPDDFDGNVEFVEDPPFGELKRFEGPTIVEDDDLYGPPTGCKEWEEWIDRDKKV